MSLDETRTVPRGLMQNSLRAHLEIAAYRKLQPEQELRLVLEDWKRGLLAPPTGGRKDVLSSIRIKQIEHELRSRGLEV